MIPTMLTTIEKQFPLTAINPGSYRNMKVRGMKFHIQAFYAEGLGHVSCMTASGFFGLMKMDTLIITPTAVDMPLFSYDRVLAMGNDTLIFELYDTLLGETDLSALDAVKKKYRALPDHDLGQHWYDSIKLPVSLSKKGKKSRTFTFNVTAEEYLSAFLSTAHSAPPCESTTKLEKSSVYVEGLLKNGGPSTDIFKKGIGTEKTSDLFRRILFGTAR
ncbi:MAG: hypothetical protein IJ955_09740 [Oscillospiraceae bacterium]|nr:hypothetical protein [Oscillospiraceae bacterium]